MCYDYFEMNETQLGYAFPQNVYFLHSTCVSTHCLFLYHQWKRKSVYGSIATDGHAQWPLQLVLPAVQCLLNILRFRVKPLQSVFSCSSTGDWSWKPEPRWSQAEGIKSGFRDYCISDFTQATSRWHGFSRGSSRTSICSPPPLSLSFFLSLSPSLYNQSMFWA